MLKFAVRRPCAGRKCNFIYGVARDRQQVCTANAMKWLSVRCLKTMPGARLTAISLCARMGKLSANAAGLLGVWIERDEWKMETSGIDIGADAPLHCLGAVSASRRMCRRHLWSWRERQQSRQACPFRRRKPRADCGLGHTSPATG